MIPAVLCSVGVAGLAVALYRLTFCRLSAAARFHLLFCSCTVLLLGPVLARLAPAGPENVQRIRTSLVLWITPSNASTAAERSGTARETFQLPFETFAVSVWTAVAGLLLIRITCGLARQLRRTPNTPSPAQAAADALRLPLGIRRHAAVLSSDAVRAPETHGWLRPVIVLPAEANDWSAERMDFVLTHELIHIRRNDWLAGIVAEITSALHWFNPFAWLLLRRLRQEREIACDDEVILARSGEEITYASHLIEIAAGHGCRVTANAVAMAHVSSLETRVRSILAKEARRGGLTMKSKIIAGAVAAVAVVLTSGMQAPAQGNISLYGTVQDASSAYVPGAVVILQDATDRSKREIARSADDGVFQFRALPAGKYVIEVSKPGFQMYRQPLPELGAGSAQQVSVVLQVGRIAETMTVTGIRPQAAAASASGAPQRIRTGGNIQFAKLIRQEKPVYPEHLKQQGVEGSVLLDAVIGRDGRIINVQPANTLVHPDLVQEAIRAVSLWEYAPTYLNGEPVEVITSITVNFTLSR